MITAILRLFPARTWLLIGAAVAVLVLILSVYLAGRGDEREATAVRTQKTEARAAVHRETAGGERAADTRINTNRLKEWNDDAEKTPDSLPDERELRRRCRQLRDAGRDLPACRGLAG